MMEERFYYLNREPSAENEHIIHAYECQDLPKPIFQIKLGFFKSERKIIKEANRYFKNVMICKCCKPKQTTEKIRFPYYQVIKEHAKRKLK